MILVWSRRNSLEKQETVAIFGQEIIQESQFLVTRKNQIKHQQQVRDKMIEKNSNHIIDTLKIEEFVELCDFDKFFFE